MNESAQRYPYEGHRFQDAATVSWTDRNASLDALQQLESALSAPTPGRELPWRRQVQVTLEALAAKLDQQARGDSEGASLLSEVALEEPRLAARVAGLRAEHDDLRHAVDSLQSQLRDLVDEASVDTADLRDRLAGVARRLRQHRAREADLIYEAVNINLGAGD